MYFEQRSRLELRTSVRDTLVIDPVVATLAVTFKSLRRRFFCSLTACLIFIYQVLKSCSHSLAHVKRRLHFHLRSLSERALGDHPPQFPGFLRAYLPMVTHSPCITNQVTRIRCFTMGQSHARTMRRLSAPVLHMDQDELTSLFVSQLHHEHLSTANTLVGPINAALTAVSRHL